MLTILWMVGAAHSVDDRVIQTLDSQIVPVQSHLTDSDPWVDRLQRRLDCQGEIQDNLVESSVPGAISVHSVNLMPGETNQNLVIRQCALVYVDKIGLQKLKRLIFPFHTFW